MTEDRAHRHEAELPNEKRESLARDQGGATMVIGVFMAVLLVAMIYYVMGIGETIMYKERMQDAADSGAFAAAVMHARGMNVIALLNMVMAAVLAVLVALKMAQALLIMATGIASVICGTGCAPPPVTWGCWACPFIPGLIAAEEEVSAIIEETEPIVTNIVNAASKAEVAIQKGMPIAAEAKVIQTGTDTYHEPTEFGFMTTGNMNPLPELVVEEDDSDLLCRKAGEQAASLFPTPIIGTTVSTFVPGYRGLLGSISATFSGHFCGDSADKAMRVTEGVELGDEEFQVRSFMRGKPSFEWSRRGVAMATWGREDGTGDSSYAALEELTKFSFAQAEYYYDDGDYGSDTDRKEWLWHMSWRARLRRFTLPGELGTITSACSSAGSGPCEQLGSLAEFDNVVVH